MKNYSTKIEKIYLTTYVLNILPLPIYDDAKNKEYENGDILKKDKQETTNY